jgi:phosphatidylglycerophosphatase GEP4
VESNTSIFDKDNTLTIPYERDLHGEIKDAFTECVGVYGRENVAILSNSVGSKEDTGHKEAKLLEEKYVSRSLDIRKKKPEVEEDIKRQFPGIKEASEVCLVGDRVMADTVMGMHLDTSRLKSNLSARNLKILWSN